MNAMPHFELIVRHAVWRTAVVPLLARRDLVATGRLTRDPGRRPTGLLIGDLAADGPARTGADFPPLADWVTIASPDEHSLDPGPWVRRLRPLSGQLLAVLVGLGSDRSGWRGWTVERGAVRPLAGLRVVGPGMVHAATPPPDDFPSEPDAARWGRVRGAVGERAFEKLRGARAAVVGCSRTGTLAAGMLAALGVRGLVLLDGDAVEPHNLDGMLLSTGAEVGENKAESLGRRLVAFRPGLMVRAVRRPLDAVTADETLGGVDLVVTCVDGDGGRLRAAHWAREHLAPHLDVGTGVTRGAGGGRRLAADVRLLLPGEGCVRCVGGLGDLEQAEYELHAPRGALPRRPPEAWDARGRLGSLVTINSMAVSSGVQSWLDLLDGSLAGSIWHRLRWEPGRGLEADSALVAASATCVLCRGRDFGNPKT
jgi:molybdopterin/thiamine biosynthesis adenylyltransferase